MHNVIPLPQKAIPLAIDHESTPYVGHRRPRHRRRRPARAARHAWKLAGRRAGRPIAVTGVAAKSPAEQRGEVAKAAKWFDDPIALATDPSIDVFVELIGGDGRHRQGRGRGGARRRQARRHRQQGAAGQARRRARQAGREERRRAQLRGGGGRRHPGHQDAARSRSPPTRCAASTASSTAPATTS